MPIIQREFRGEKERTDKKEREEEKRTEKKEKKEGRRGREGKQYTIISMDDKAIITDLFLFGGIDIHKLNY